MAFAGGKLPVKAGVGYSSLNKQGPKHAELTYLGNTELYFLCSRSFPHRCRYTLEMLGLQIQLILPVLTVLTMTGQATRSCERSATFSSTYEVSAHQSEEDQ